MSAVAAEALIPVPPLSRWTLLRVFVRSFFLQAAWNPEHMQNLGFCFAITPALEVLYPERELRQRALERHLEFFNCHPYLADAILGAAIHAEERIARGQERPESVVQLKRVLGPPFAALGDGFYWLALRPAAALAAALTIPALGLGCIAVFLALYNAIHFFGRGFLFVRGVQLGPGVIDVVARAQVPSGTGLLKASAAVLAGALAARAVLAAALPHTGSVHWRPALLVATVIVASVVTLPRLKPLTALYLALLLGLAIGGGFF
jgi:PTS system mannose-specific IID component